MTKWCRKGAVAAFTLFLFAHPACVQAKEIVALLDTHVQAYAEALAGFEKRSRATVRVLKCRRDGRLGDERAMIPRIRALHPLQVLVVGREPLEALAGRIKGVPIVFCMVAKPARIIAGRRNITGVSTDIPAGKLMAMAGRFSKQIHRIGVVYNPNESGAIIAAARKALARQHQVLDAKPARSRLEAMTAVREVMPKVDAYWVIMDRSTRSTDVIRYVFALAHYDGKSLIGATERHVQTGSLFAFSADNTGMGRQAANLSNKLLGGKRIASLPVEAPKRLILSLNRASFQKHAIPLSQDMMSEAGHIY